MYTVERRIEIDMGHRVPFHDSKCSKLHGHRYVILVEAQAEKTITYGNGSGESSSGMLVDFGDLKAAMMKTIHDPFDHRLVLYEFDSLLAWFAEKSDLSNFGIVTVPFIPTAEELARYWWEEVQRELITGDYALAKDLIVTRVTVHETPNSVASFMP